ncbi:MAG: TlpA family protein disulfide reductase [Chloroflexi bacterium]|nr:TlpA family protein disulfide reductase [Chloroflexota bacterium]
MRITNQLLMEENMQRFTILTGLIVVASTVLSACGGPASAPQAIISTPTEAMAAHDTATPDAMMMDETATPDAMMAQATPAPDEMMQGTASSQAMMDVPGWYGAALTNVRTGESFTINDFKGKVVLVETMAVWCSNCRTQQGEVKALHDRVGLNSDLVSVALDIDPNENQGDLKSYAEKNGFDWLYAVAPADVAREIGQLYTDQFLNPPSAPILIIDRHGVAHPLPFGIKSAADLFKTVDAYLKEGM